MGDEDDEDDEDDDEEMEYSDEEGMHGSEAAQAALADAQSASLEAATDAHYAAASGSGVASAQKNPADELGIAAEDIPEEFLDPITQQYMVEPVVLPSSGATLDRSTVLRHLRTNPSDPYTQVRLTAQMLQPATELRGKMAVWLAGKKATLGSS
uniref:RING-type E3 ubiquitin transferase n=1 Tax=Hemiselmis tepida TaxID=464990 RepID=A0A7S0YLE5_9CRYP|mmetsp:Transcript_16279/g.41171  ORF Transcript_16279/g.41171 Transcript_16279/m.41171 type:complete len:154 (+) Transcript_16279:3-464(+)